MSTFLSHLHEDLRRARLTRRGASGRFSSEDPVGKTYPRMELVALPEPEALRMPLDAALKMRASAQTCNTAPLSRGELGTLLGHALRTNGAAHRPYPSGGARFPIETYFAGSLAQEAETAAFHYRPDLHALERLWNLPRDIEFDSLVPHGKPDEFQCSGLLIFTSVWERSAAKYGDFAYPLSLLEAGHAAQNILLAAAALDLPARPMGGFDDERIARILDLNEEAEQPAHAIALGKPA